MYSDTKYDDAIKFKVLSTWLKNRLEDNQEIHEEEIKELLISMDITVEEKVIYHVASRGE